MIPAREDPAGAFGSPFPLVYLILAFPMFVAAFGSLPRKLDFGPISGMGALTVLEVGLAAAGLLACRRYPKGLLLRAMPYTGFLAWVALTTIWARPQLEGAQNALVYILFGVMVLFGGTLAARNPYRLEHLIDRGVTWITSVALTFVALELAHGGLPSDSEEAWWIGPRPVAILGLVVLSRLLTRWYYGDKWPRVWIVLWMAAIVASISRAATATALGMVGVVVLAQVRFRRRRLAITLPAAVGAVSVVLALAMTWAPFQERMFHGDAAVTVGGTGINVSGRLTMWRAILASARESPVIGKGLGSAQVVVAAAFANTPSQMTQPHNDYLRLWHDLGAIGLALYLAGTFSWMGMLGRDWYRGERSGAEPARLEFSGFLTLFALSLIEVTDNPIVYQSVMGTAGLFVGAALGARVYRSRHGRPEASAARVVHRSVERLGRSRA
jgi:O-antigen ligase